MCTNVELAVIELDNSGTLSDFMSLPQRLALKRRVLDGDQDCTDKVLKISERIRKMPATYETNFVDNNNKVIHLRYIKGHVAAWIIEKDKGNELESLQTQAFGYVDLYGNGIGRAELGYISILELTISGMELDIDFEPETYGTLKGKVS